MRVAAKIPEHLAVTLDDLLVVGQTNVSGLQARPSEPIPASRQ